MAEAGYESGTLGVWAWVCTLQAVVGLLCLFLSWELVNYESVIELENPPQLPYVTGSTFRALGTAAVVSAVILMVCTFLGYFVFPHFCTLLVGLAGLLTECVALTVTVIIGLTLGKNSGLIRDILWKSSKYDEHIKYIEYTVSFAHVFNRELTTVAVLAFVAFVLAARAQVMSPNGRAVDAILYSGTLAFAAALGIFISIKHESISSLLPTGVVWLLAAGILYVLLQQQKVCWPRFTYNAVTVVHVISVLLGIVSVCVPGKRFFDHKTIAIIYQDELLSKKVPASLLAQVDTFTEMLDNSQGMSHVVLSMLGGVAILLSLAGATVSFRTILGPSRAEKEMAQGDAAHALETRSWA